MTRDESGNVVDSLACWFSSQQLSLNEATVAMKALRARFRKVAVQRPRKDKADEEDRLMEAVLRGPLGNSTSSGAWRAWMREVAGWRSSKFDDKLREFKKRHPELKGCRWPFDPYWLDAQPSEAMVELVGKLTSTATPLHPSLEERGVVRGNLDVPRAVRAILDRIVQDDSSQGSAKDQNSPADELARLRQQLG
jgi:hypothetical protein